MPPSEWPARTYGPGTWARSSRACRSRAVRPCRTLAGRHPRAGLRPPLLRRGRRHRAAGLDAPAPDQRLRRHGPSAGDRPHTGTHGPRAALVRSQGRRAGDPGDAARPRHRGDAGRPQPRRQADDPRRPPAGRRHRRHRLQGRLGCTTRRPRAAVEHPCPPHRPGLHTRLTCRGQGRRRGCGAWRSRWR